MAITKYTKNIEIVFPIIGHLFMPSDRVFGLIESVLKKIEQIVKIKEYHEVFHEYRSVKILGEDWTDKNWKTEAKSMCQRHNSSSF